jgi:hypothetical protein
MKKNVIGCQVGAISFVDEGVEHVLDFLRDECAVNSVFISALSWARGNAGRALERYPDHGPKEPDNLKGGAFFKPDPKYYRSTYITAFEAPDPLYHGFDTLRDVIPEAEKRNMDVYVYYCETSRLEPRSRWVPGWVHLLEVDILGRRGYRPCYNNPDYINWFRCVIEDFANNHELEGILWNFERKSPICAVLDGETPVCFCRHCRELAHMRGIDADRAKEGYSKLYQYVKDCKAGVKMSDGYLATFLRILFRYPEILQWEKMWYESHIGFGKDLYGTYKWLNPDKSFGVGFWQVIDTFSFWLRSIYDYADLIECADFVKPIVYHKPAGPRYRDYLKKRAESVLRDFESFELMYEAMSAVSGIRQGPAGSLGKDGFTADYVSHQVKRIIEKTNGTIPVFPAICSGVPTGKGDVEASPQDVYEGAIAGYKAGAKGFVLARNYSEAYLDNMRAAKRVVQELQLDIESDASSEHKLEKSVY